MGSFIVRGTTPLHTFWVNKDLRNCDVYITYAQSRRVLFERTNDSLIISEESIVCRLTQEETLKLNPNVNVQIQIRYTDGTNAGASEIFTVDAEQVLKDGEI